ncbi:hypothetical protein [Neolewinella agarilytica]|uniref:Uncharacterized protein n=1 Tax=Neolewinella agarilytica TaxID=478744 RepID=A0A1H9ABS7_9BACT|nr:hypothetical protein [Neolewinella agarilytica]SEP73937.1 hypothetical protein SAMN05444359_10233 [Neolewinella agarilytica]
MLTACEKDGYIPLDETPIHPEEVIRNKPIIVERNLVSEEVLVLRSEIINSVTNLSTPRTKDGKFENFLDSILLTPAYIVNDTSGNAIVYSFLLEEKSIDVFANLVVRIDSLGNSTSFVYQYEMDTEFSIGFNSGKDNISNFSGAVRIRPLSTLLQFKEKCNLGDCFKILVGKPDYGTTPSGGGGGGSGEAGGPGGRVTTGPTTVHPSGGDCWHVEEYGCEQSGCTTVITFEPWCGLVFLWPDDKSNNCGPDDCGEFIKILGIIPRRLLSSVTQTNIERLDILLKDLPYDGNVINYILNENTFEECFSDIHNSGNCVRAQVVDYLNSVVPLTGNGSFPFTDNYNGFSDEELSAFLNAVVLANGNDHVVESVNYLASKNLQDIPSTVSLPDLIAYLGYTSVNAGEAFTTAADDFLSIVSAIEIHNSPSPISLSWLATHPESISLLVSSVSDPIIAEGISLSIEIIAGLHENMNENEQVTTTVWAFSDRYRFNASSKLYLLDIAEILDEESFSSESKNFIRENASKTDRIANSVDCSEDPCLCDVINKWKSARFITKASRSIFRVFRDHNGSDNLEITTSSVSGEQLASTTWAHTSLPTTPPGLDIDGGQFKITFNSDKPMNCTQVGLAATLLHELLHAHIAQQRIHMSTADFANRYPLFSTGTNNESGSHIEMADKYVETITSDLVSLFPDLEPSYAYRLAWVGLDNTPAFRAKEAADPNFRQNVIDADKLASCQSGMDSERDAVGMTKCY